MDWQLLITDLMTKRGLSQSQIARYCGCAQATISEYANNPLRKRGPGFQLGQSLVALSKVSDRELERIKSTDAKAAA